MVREWQQILKDRGLYTGAIDGDFGPRTLAASREALGLPQAAPGWRPALTSADNAVLDTVKADLRDVVERAAALSTQRFRVTDGLRTLARQQELLDKGFSKTLNSRHLTGDAVDLTPCDDAGRILPSANIDAFRPVIAAMQAAASELGYPLTSYGTKFGWDWYHHERTRGK